jgi:DNA topoisomerase-1
MEDELDAVSRGEEEWTTPLEKFWKPFIDQVDKIEKNVTREQVAQARELGKDPATGKPVTVRMGRFGPFVQIGTKDDEEKPRFAGLRPGQKMDALTLAVAMELFKLPRTLGVTADGETVITNVGRFGPYVKYGSKYVSLKEDDPYEVSLERALEVIRLKQEADANRTITDFGVDGIQVLNGRYGPYVTDSKKNAKIPKDRDPKTLTLEECRVLIEQAPARGAGRFGRGKRGSAGKQAAGGKAADSRAAAARGNGKAGANGTDGGATAGEKAGKGKRPRPKAPATAGVGAKSAKAGGKSTATTAAANSAGASTGASPAATNASAKSATTTIGAKSTAGTDGGQSATTPQARAGGPKKPAAVTKPAAKAGADSKAAAGGKGSLAGKPPLPAQGVGKAGAKPPANRPRGEK